MHQLALSMRLPDRASFESFLPGDNGAAVDTLRALAAGRRRDVVWLAGPAGSGKTHLLHAVVARCAQDAAAGYLPLAAPAPAAAAGAAPLAGVATLAPEVLEGWQGVRCLCLDDVPALFGDAAWERALFRLHREAEEQGISLVLSGSESPALVRPQLRDLASRLGASTVCVLQPLDEAQQREALRLRAHLRGLQLPDETLQYLQRHMPRDMRSLYRLLDTLDEAALQAQRRLTVPFIRAVLERSPPAAR
ncbi:MAG: DnaA regulatory inactivator Hda [Steroidobacteraceae bacterium]